MSRDNDLGKGLLIGFITGSVIGSIVALLYAPKSGKELRQDIKEKTDELMEEAEGYLANAKVKATELMNDGKKKSEKLIAETKIKVDGLMKEAEQVLQEAKSKTNDIIASGKSNLEKESEKLKNAFKAGMDAYKNEQKG